MASANDLSIREAELKHLRMQIDEEINQVEQVLQACVDACNEYPSDDDFFKVVEETGNVLKTNWGYLIDTFQGIGSELDNLINKIGDLLAQAIESLRSVGN